MERSIMSATIAPHDIKGLVELQLAGAAVGQRGMVAVRQLYSNIKKYTELHDLEYAQFLSTLDSLRDELNIRPGEIGLDVNYLTLRKE
jgi:hypothetical protein